MISYDRDDQASYYAERSYHFCVLVGAQPELITSSNYASIRELLYLSFSGRRLARAINELSSLLFFSVTLGYPTEAPNA